MRSFACCLLAAALTAQEPAVTVQFAADADGKGPPALVWLRQDFLPGRSGWPRGLDARSAFVLRASPLGLSARAAVAPMPQDAYAAGEFRPPGDAPILLSCDRDGVEDWFVPGDTVLPRRAHQLLADLGADALGFRTMDVAALAGHFGRVVEGDPESPLLGLGAAWCGEVTWHVFVGEPGLRVRGRSGGGLLLPCAIVFWATLPDARDPSSWWNASAPLPARWQLRAFSARDGDRAEAARQLGRSDAAVDPTVLTALLHADDQSRLAAMDGLVRQQDAAALPRIIRAADPQLPETVAMAQRALTELWPLATPATQTEVRRLLARHPALTLRTFDLPVLAGQTAAPANGSTALRTFALLAVLQCLCFGLWLRERRRLQRHGIPHAA
jgi:hypothetical protein